LAAAPLTRGRDWPLNPESALDAAPLIRAALVSRAAFNVKTPGSR
jgi:hypothetical protein